MLLLLLAVQRRHRGCQPPLPEGAGPSVERSERVSYHGSTARAAVLVGTTPVTKLGVRMLTVGSPPFPCPKCGVHSSRMWVYEKGVRWPCGHTRSLPPLPPGITVRLMKEGAAAE